MSRTVGVKCVKCVFLWKRLTLTAALGDCLHGSGLIWAVSAPASHTECQHNFQHEARLSNISSELMDCGSVQGTLVDSVSNGPFLACSHGDFLPFNQKRNYKYFSYILHSSNILIKLSCRWFCFTTNFHSLQSLCLCHWTRLEIDVNIPLRTSLKHVLMFNKCLY